MVKKILHIDHQAHIGRLMKVNLERAGYNCTTVQTVTALFEQLNGVELVIIGDIDAEANENWKVLQRLKNNAATRDIPTMMLTIRGADEDVFRGWHWGVDCYVTKPYNPLEILNFVERIFTSLDGLDEAADFELEDDDIFPR